MNNDLAIEIILDEVLHKFAVLYADSIKNEDKEKIDYYGEILDALNLAVEEMEQNEKFREAINGFAL